MIDIQISDDTKIDQYTIEIESDKGFQYFYDIRDVNLPSFDIRYHLEMSSTNVHDFYIIIKVEDEDGNTTKKRVKVLTES